VRVSSDPAARRRLAALACSAALAALLGMVVGARAGGEESVAGAEGPDPVERPETEDSRDAGTVVDRLSPRQLAGQLIVLRFMGTEVPEYVEVALREGRAAGVILFGDNITSAEQLRAMTRTIQEAAGGSALICTDQEGGAIRNLPWAAPSIAAPAQATREQAERAARDTARDLRAAGVNVNLAPVADVALEAGSVMRGRAYPGRAEQVSELITAAVGAYGEGSVAATVKHFPGLGAASGNTDDERVTIERPRAEIEQVDLPPFRAGIEAGTPLVMSGHAVYPAYDRERIASQSPAILTELLRGDLGFEGVIVTDSLEAEAVVSRSPDVDTSAVRSLQAGNDLMLTTGQGSYRPILLRFMEEAERSPEFAARMRESAARVLALKEQLGLEEPPEE
jgi:beta-N-acetylhexosaminidase